jgi:hypothetical protein
MTTSVKSSGVEESLIKQFKDKINNALKVVAPQCPEIVRNKVVVDNKNVNDDDIPAKKVVSKGESTEPLVGKTGDMLSPSNFTAEVTEENQLIIKFTPPSYYFKMIEQNSQRSIIEENKINPEVKQEIIKLIKDEIEK